MKNEYAIIDDVAHVKLTQGQTMRVAETDLPKLAPYRWFAQQDTHTCYARANVRLENGGWAMLHAHRLLVGLDFGDRRMVDHLDHNGLNNLPSNLQVVAGSKENQYNQRGKRCRRNGRSTSSRRPGVSWHKPLHCWRSQICVDGRKTHLGLFKDESDAGESYNRAKAVRDGGGTAHQVKEAGRSQSQNRAG